MKNFLGPIEVDSERVYCTKIWLDHLKSTIDGGLLVDETANHFYMFLERKGSPREGTSHPPREPSYAISSRIEIGLPGWTWADLNPEHRCVGRLILKPFQLESGRCAARLLRNRAYREIDSG